jgi:hypothetical protein
MKRVREDDKQENDYEKRNKKRVGWTRDWGLVNNRLTLLPNELFPLIMSHLSIKDLQSLCTYLWFNQPSVIPFAAKFLSNAKGPEIQALREEINRTILGIINYESLDLKSRKTKPSEALSKIEKMINDPYYNVDVFTTTPLCSRCESSFYHKILWKTTDRKLCICHECDKVLKKTLDEKELSLDVYKDGWAWIGATQMKVVCRIPKNQKAEEFATTHSIRTRSSSMWTVGGSSSHRMFYFLKDVLPFVTTEGKGKGVEEVLK